jgi:hypothetical protein
MFVVFLPFVLVMRKELRPNPSLAAIESLFPVWARVLCVTTFVYALVNFALFASRSGGGNADILNGEYVLRSHGHVLAHLTESQYHLHKATEIRGFSGHWLLFYLIPCIYFWFRREQHSGAQPL